MGFRTSLQADEDIFGIYAGGVRQFGVSQAEKYLGSLFDVFDLLSRQPAMARERTEFRPPVRVHFHDQHVIVYVEAGRDILIVRVLSGREDWERNI